MNFYPVGDIVRITGEFADREGTPVDPEALILRVRPPDGATFVLTYGVDPELVRLSTGVYYADVEATTPGAWYSHFEAAGQPVVEQGFRVATPKVSDL